MMRSKNVVEQEHNRNSEKTEHAQRLMTATKINQGKPEVECGDTTIEVVFLTEALFEGRIFVIGRANDSNCFSRDVGRRTTSILIDKNKCGVATTRSIDPPGLVSNVKIMISFHNDFITKVDRGYEISCLYMQADKTVTYPLTVATQEIAGITELAEMPRCRYEVIDPDTKEALMSSP
ncbi:hypothetical protein OSTOST_14753 [Ostertagia ostertagi]